MSTGPVMVALYEALKKFGRITPQNCEQVARWVQKRVEQLQRERVNA